MSERDSYSNLEEILDLSEHVAISPREVRRIIADARRYRDEAAEAKRLMLQVVDDKYAAIQDGDRARAEAADLRAAVALHRPGGRGYSGCIQGCTGGWPCATRRAAGNYVKRLP